MSPEMMELCKGLATAIVAAVGAAIGNSRTARKALAKMRRELRAMAKELETLRGGQERERTERREAEGATRQRFAYLTGAVHLVGSALGLKVRIANGVPVVEAPAGVAVKSSGTT